MLELDLIGIGASVFLAAALIPARRRWLLALLVVALGEVGHLLGRLSVEAPFQGHVAAGAVGRLAAGTVPSPAAWWGIAFTLVAGWAFGRPAGRAATVYGLLSAALLLLLAWLR